MAERYFVIKSSWCIKSPNTRRVAAQKLLHSLLSPTFFVFCILHPTCTLYPPTHHAPTMSTEVEGSPKDVDMNDASESAEVRRENTFGTESRILRMRVAHTRLPQQAFDSNVFMTWMVTHSLTHKHLHPSVSLTAWRRQDTDNHQYPSIRNQEMECRGHVVVGYLRRHCKSCHVMSCHHPVVFGISCLFYFLSTDMRHCTDNNNIPVYSLFMFTHYSAPFVAILSMNPRSSTRPTPRLPTTMAWALPLATVDTYFTWTAFKGGSRRGVCVLSVTRSGTLPRLSAFRDMDSWESKTKQAWYHIYSTS
jgi:hypothetical protein